MEPGIDYVGVGCGAFIINEKNQLLLLKRNKKCRNKAGYWTIPGGRIEFFEKIEDALKREIKEELDIDIKIIKLLSVTNDIIKEENQHWVSPQFLCKIVKGTPKNLETDKCDEIKWFDINNMPDKLTNTTTDGLKHLKEYLSIS
jgi:ADP-ribose pyrophosphatase YjhB (NUDIX family)